MNRREFMARMGAGTVAAGMALNARAATARPLNVLMIMSDEHNPRVSSVYGHPLVQTPNLERLAARGVVFENCYCPSPLCLPSRSAVMAGRYVHELQTYNNCNAVTHDYPSYGAVLAAQGVHTAYAGKVDVYRPAEELGFNDMMLPGDRKHPGDTNFERAPLKVRDDAASRADGFGPKPDPFQHDTQVVDAAIEWLRSRAADAGPWTLSVNTGSPHFPHYVTDELWEMYADGADLPEYRGDVESALHPYARDLRAHFETDQFTDEQVRGLRRGYLGCVTYVDRQVGRLLDALEQSGLAENTLVAYTSDHGEMLGKFNMWWKCSLYEDSARVPLVVAGPGFAQGTRVATPVSTLDLQAAMFRATGAERPAEWRGTPLQDIPARDDDRPVFAEYHGHGTRSGAYLIRQGPWKLIYCMAAPHQLFNLDDDPEELVNLADKNPRKRGELEEILRGICDPERENDRAHAFNERQLEAIAEKT